MENLRKRISEINGALEILETLTPTKDVKEEIASYKKEKAIMEGKIVKLLKANSNKTVEPEVNYVRPETTSNGFQEFQRSIERKMADLMTLQTNLINILSSNAKKEEPKEEPKVEAVQQPIPPITPQAALAPEDSGDIKLGWFSKIAIAAGIVYVGKYVLDLYTENTELKCNIKE